MSKITSIAFSSLKNNVTGSAETLLSPIRANLGKRNQLFSDIMYSDGILLTNGSDYDGVIFDKMSASDCSCSECVFTVNGENLDCISLYFDKFGGTYATEIVVDGVLYKNSSVVFSCEFETTNRVVVEIKKWSKPFEPVTVTRVLDYLYTSVTVSNQAPDNNGGQVALKIRLLPMEGQINQVEVFLPPKNNLTGAVDQLLLGVKKRYGEEFSLVTDTMYSDGILLTPKNSFDGIVFDCLADEKGNCHSSKFIIKGENLTNFSLYFDGKTNEYATEIAVDGVLYKNSSVVFSCNKLASASSVTVEIKKWSKPFGVPRVSRVFRGLTVVFKKFSSLKFTNKITENGKKASFGFGINTGEVKLEDENGLIMQLFLAEILKDGLDVEIIRNGNVVGVFKTKSVDGNQFKLVGKLESLQDMAFEGYSIPRSNDIVGEKMALNVLENICPYIVRMDVETREHLEKVSFRFPLIEKTTRYSALLKFLQATCCYMFEKADGSVFVKYGNGKGSRLSPIVVNQASKLTPVYISKNAVEKFEVAENVVTVSGIEVGSLEGLENFNLKVESSKDVSTSAYTCSYNFCTVLSHWFSNEMKSYHVEDFRTETHVGIKMVNYGTESKKEIVGFPVFDRVEQDDGVKFMSVNMKTMEARISLSTDNIYIDYVHNQGNLCPCYKTKFSTMAGGITEEIEYIHIKLFRGEYVVAEEKIEVGSGTNDVSLQESGNGFYEAQSKCGGVKLAVFNGENTIKHWANGKMTVDGDVPIKEYVRFNGDLAVDTVGKKQLLEVSDSVIFAESGKLLYKNIEGKAKVFQVIESSYILDKNGEEQKIKTVEENL